MPIDPSIPLSVRPIQLPDLGQVYQQAQQTRIQRETADSIAAERKAQTALRQQQADAVAREQAESTALTTLFGSGQPVAPTDIYKIVGPKRGADILKGMLDLQSANLKSDDEVRASMTRRVGALVALPEPMRADAYKHVADDYVGRGLMKAEDIPAYSPEVLQHYANSLLTPDKQYDITHPKPIEVTAGSSLMGPDGKLLGTAPKPEEHSPAYKEWQDAKATGYAGSFTQYQNDDANRHRPVVNVGGQNSLYNATDPKVIAEGIRNGTMPPKIADYGRAVQGAVATELGKSGYNLASAITDWTATQKHIATMNGAQQLRLNQAINSLPEMLDSVDRLAAQWKGGQFPILNKANLALAKGGAYGKEVASVANQLDAQIADVTADLGNVYMGGNSPTDHALGLAGKSLSGDWDEKVLHDMVTLAKGNVTIRRNSINNTGVAGASAGNVYAPQAQGAAPAPSDLTKAPPPPPPPAGRIRVQGPNGETGTMPANSALPAGWSKVGG